jgi:hypothetical protein
MDRKSTFILIALAIAVIVIILLINYVRGNGNHNSNPEEVIKCIGENAKLIVSPTCGHCANQKKILEEYYENYTDYIELLDISKNPELWNQYNLEGVPTWIVGKDTYPGVRTISAVRKITEC